MKWGDEKLNNEQRDGKIATTTKTTTTAFQEITTSTTSFSEITSKKHGTHKQYYIAKLIIQSSS